MYEIFAKLLKRKKLKAADVTRATEIKSPVFSEWKKGKSNPNTEKLIKIANFLDVSVEYLTGNSYIEDMGSIIREERLKNGVTQEEIADCANISVSELDAYELQDKPIRADIFDDIAEALGTSYFELLYDYDLYDEYIPPHFNGDVVRYEAFKRARDKDAMMENAGLVSYSKEPQLKPRDEKDIKEILSSTEQLLKQDGLMFDGQPASPEAIDSILSAMQIGMEMAKKKNKEKYTPKKYKKD